MFCRYDLYEETTPYFTPTTVTASNQSSGIVLARTGDVDTNYYYKVVADCTGVGTAVSNTVGEFDFELVSSE